MLCFPFVEQKNRQNYIIEFASEWNPLSEAVSDQRVTKLHGMLYFVRTCGRERERSFFCAVYENYDAFRWHLNASNGLIKMTQVILYHTKREMWIAKHCKCVLYRLDCVRCIMLYYSLTNGKCNQYGEPCIDMSARRENERQEHYKEVLKSWENG